MEQVNEPLARIKNASMFKAARAVADNCKDKTRRDILRARVDLCRADFDRFSVSASQVDMEQLVASWTRMLLAVAAVDPLGGEPAGAGKVPVPRSKVDAPPVAPALDLSRFAS
jgi:hypothetical protein